jgi:hypothetical protein
MAEKQYIERDRIVKFIEDGLNDPDKTKAFGHDATEGDRTMTDTEIIKSLECCRNPIPMCDDCPVGSGGMCFDFLKDYAIGLINRQKAEIERLTDLINEIAESNEDLVRDNHDLYVSLKKTRCRDRRTGTSDREHRTRSRIEMGTRGDA